MGTGRNYPAAAALVDGRVLVTGGYTRVCDPNPDLGCVPINLASAEVYAP